MFEFCNAAAAAVEEAFQTRVSHVVFMGMGEPLMNMKNVVRAIRDLNERVGIGERHITVSTVGVPNQLRRSWVFPHFFEDLSFS